MEATVIYKLRRLPMLGYIVVSKDQDEDVVLVSLTTTSTFLAAIIKPIQQLKMPYLPSTSQFLKWFSGIQNIEHPYIYFILQFFSMITVPKVYRDIPHLR